MGKSWRNTIWTNLVYFLLVILLTYNMLSLILDMACWCPEDTNSAIHCWKICGSDLLCSSTHCSGLWTAYPLPPFCFCCTWDSRIYLSILLNASVSQTLPKSLLLLTTAISAFTWPVQLQWGPALLPNWYCGGCAEDMRDILMFSNIKLISLYPNIQTLLCEFPCYYLFPEIIFYSNQSK